VGSGGFWWVLVCSGGFWCVLICSGVFWSVLVRFLRELSGRSQCLQKAHEIPTKFPSIRKVSGHSEGILLPLPAPPGLPSWLLKAFAGGVRGGQGPSPGPERLFRNLKSPKSPFLIPYDPFKGITGIHGSPGSPWLFHGLPINPSNLRNL
jgi:hypothetical protein